MALQIWQIGLDIQNGQLCALAVQQRRNGWQLRHWWQHDLPQDTLRNGLMQRPDIVSALLQRWRRLLPGRFSLRVGFPPHPVMQRPLSLPAMRLHEPDRHRYITAAARQLFPIEPEALALDYRSAAAGQLMLTATRQEALHSWVSCLQQAGLVPQVLELTPGALGVLAGTLNLDPHATLVHRTSDHWLWYAPQHAEQPWGWCALEEAADFGSLRLSKLPAAGEIWYSSALAEPPPPGTLALSPLQAMRFWQPPLPACAGAFSLAIGLALRPEDR